VPRSARSARSAAVGPGGSPDEELDERAHRRPLGVGQSIEPGRGPSPPALRRTRSSISACSPGLDADEREAIAFPNGEHDDRLDAMICAAALKPGNQFYFTSGRR